MMTGDTLKAYSWSRPDNVSANTTLMSKPIAILAVVFFNVACCVSSSNASTS